MLISSISSGDLSAIHSLLFSSFMLSSLSSSSSSSSILVNQPDSKGWGPIHHCVAALAPSSKILDALYCAGGDVSLFTTHEQQTPLHILARSFQSADLPHSLATFILHLVLDLRAPLSARDKNDETCIHIAAEHGVSPGLLMLLLQCDESGTVRKMKNSRG
jgi:ankyrin repeat protein